MANPIGTPVADLFPHFSRNLFCTHQRSEKEQMLLWGISGFLFFFLFFFFWFSVYVCVGVCVCVEKDFPFADWPVSE